MSNYLIPKRKTCPECGRAFDALSPKSYRCPECQTLIRRERHLAQMRAWAKRHSTAVHEERKCKLCGKKFITSRGNQKYCSNECMVLWNRHNDGEKARAARALNAAARKAARKIPRAKTPKPKAPPPESWKIRVERELAIPDPDARFAAAQKWTPKERKYAQKLAMRGMGWRGPAYGI